MARIEDRWHRKDRTRTAEYGKVLRWRVEWHEPGGERRRRSFDSKRDAEAFLAETRTSLRRGDYVADDGTTVGDLWPRFRATKAGLSASSVHAYDAAWIHHLEEKWAEAEVQKIRSTHVQEWLPGLKASNKRGQRVSASYEGFLLMVLRSLLNFAVDDGKLTKNPLTKIKRRKIPATARRYLTVQESDRLLARLAEMGQDFDLVALIMLRTGCRPGEAWGLQKGDYDPRRKRLRVQRDIDSQGNADTTKTGKHRDLPVSGELGKRLDQRVRGLKRADWIACHPSGEPWTTDRWRPVWEKARAVTGYDDLDTYELRHTGISWAIHAGANVKTVQRMAGHASAKITLDTYGHLWDDQLDVIAEKVDKHLDEERKNGGSDQAETP
ncbi:site-specific integrase [Acaricomes phytoseiuli]|uniref:tyrosine-type recombinase/integrase n=1 Tax=Acaricomes phytoseiuli TaxID=291968 RepID=UPI002222CBF7|nr:site-specific integrase [Acaricomes phytoseiuli]MCW1249627.1 site-specific integrase [Acaricomes phytoseiuli]